MVPRVLDESLLQTIESDDGLVWTQDRTAQHNFQALAPWPSAFDDKHQQAFKVAGSLQFALHLKHHPLATHCYTSSTASRLQAPGVSERPRPLITRTSDPSRLLASCFSDHLCLHKTKTSTPSSLLSSCAPEYCRPSTSNTRAPSRLLAPCDLEHIRPSMTTNNTPNLNISHSYWNLVICVSSRQSKMSSKSSGNLCRYSFPVGTSWRYQSINQSIIYFEILHSFLSSSIGCALQKQLSGCRYKKHSQPNFTISIMCKFTAFWFRALAEMLSNAVR